MGILRADRVAGLGGANAINGSVHFNGNHLDISGVDTAFGTGGNWTMECWINPQEVALKAITDPRTGGSTVHPLLWISGGNGGKTVGVLYYYTAGADRIVGTTVLQSGTWYHVAVVRNSGTTHLYVNGTSEGSFSDTLDYASTPTFRIGARYSSTPYNYNGYISNFRLINGTALYTANFTPPAQRLENISGTEILCCQSPGNVEQEATGKTITAPVPTNGAAAQASHFAPDKGEDYGTTFADNTKFDTLSYMVLPGGTTAERGRGRGLVGGGFTPGVSDQIYSVEIASDGTSSDFGNLSMSRRGTAAVSSSTRAVWAGGYAPGYQDRIDYVNISAGGKAIDFGNLDHGRFESSGVSNGTRGVYGPSENPAQAQNVIQYITIASAGNATDFGDSSISTGTKKQASMNSTTRGLFAGGQNVPSPSAFYDIIDYITIASTGNATDFGDLTENVFMCTGFSDATRGVRGGGNTSPTASNTNTIDYITIASAGNATNFGDLITANQRSGGMSNSIRGLFCGGSTPNSNTFVSDIAKIIIQTTGNATDFGDYIGTKASQGAGCSDSHGGIS